MTHQEQLRDLSATYLKSVIAEACESTEASVDSTAPLQELGIDSFRVLKIIKRLEADFGRLPKSLLFEHFTVDALAGHFSSQHAQTVAAMFAVEMQPANGHKKNGNGASHPTPAPRRTGEHDPIVILEEEASLELKALVASIYERFKSEGSVSRGTRKIAPYLFIGSSKAGYFNFGRKKNILVVYSYTGPREYVPVLLEEVDRYCSARQLQFNFLAVEEAASINGRPFSATPFGVLQRIVNLKQFSLDGGPMRHLRHHVTRFQKSGQVRSEEYRNGSDPEVDTSIANMIDRWCESRTMVNPLVRDVREEILTGTLPSSHRLFLTYLDNVLQNVILITPLSAADNGYLMDLEFYPQDMAKGGLEFAIVQIIAALASEGCDLLSLGGTYGCKLTTPQNADPEIDQILDELRQQKIFNDEGNFQFKNKFRPENRSIFLCRPVGSGDENNVLDIIMMIADPDPLPAQGRQEKVVAALPQKPAQTSPAPASSPAESVQASEGISEGQRRTALLNAGFNPLNLSPLLVEFDLKTDSWAQLRMPAIATQMEALRSQLQQPISVDRALRGMFPFKHFLLTTSGEAAENVLFRAWPGKGTVLQNLLFPSAIFHQIDKGFSNRELPHPAVFDLCSQEPYKGNVDWEALKANIVEGAIACVYIEVGNNAAGGQPVSLEHLQAVRALLEKRCVPVVLDITRVLQNSLFLIENERESAAKSIWEMMREICSCADVVIGSLTKEFCVDKGGIIATNDEKLFRRLEETAGEEGSRLDLIDQKLVAPSLEKRKLIEAKLLARAAQVRALHEALRRQNVPVAQPAGGHCVLIDPKQVEEFKTFACPAQSFLAWLYLNTGIRAGEHSVGMQRNTSINQLVRLAIPLGLTGSDIYRLTTRLIDSFARIKNIPELAKAEGRQPEKLSAASYKLVQFHRQEEAEAAAHAPAIQRETPSAPLAAANVVPPASGTQPGTPEKQLPQEASAPERARDVQPIAIIGVAGRYPKARDLRALWKNLAEGRDCIEEISGERRERRPQHEASSLYRGGFIDDVDKFDSLFFNISPSEARMLDPQERLFLEVAWEALEDGGYYPEILSRADGAKDVGVFVGAVWTMYQMLGVEKQAQGNVIRPNSFLWSIANRVSYWMNFSGPSITLDTACSSSLTAIYLACEAIRAGDCSAAIAGGVNLDLHQAKLDINAAGGALSSDGVCRSFGKGANGYVGGEGVGAVLLKPLDQAIKDGDNIYGVIKSAVVNHGGRTNGYTVPNPKAQADLILAALKRAGIDAKSVGYVEAHGTGTALGDPVEVAGLNSAFQAHGVERHACALGSIKSNIGHLEAAAGVVSVSKVLLQMRNRCLVPSLHSSELNEFIDFENSPFYVVQKLEEWRPKNLNDEPVPLRAGISSFGAGGTNAHILLEAYEPAVSADPIPPGEFIFPLSARDGEQLRHVVERLAAYLRENDVALHDVAHTLQIGRKAFDHRLAVVAASRAELLGKLEDFLQGKKSAGIVTGQAKSGEALSNWLGREEKAEFLRLLGQSRDPRKLAGLWVEGVLPGWQGLRPGSNARRISLPTYPFRDQRHWVTLSSPVAESSSRLPSLHPMLDSNQSTFACQRFKKTFSEQDFCIYDHHVATIPTLPGVAYLEMARIAGEISGAKPIQKIKNILWLSPISVQASNPKEVSIELTPADGRARFEVFSTNEQGARTVHSQGTLLYAAQGEAPPAAEYVDLESIRGRCEKVVDGRGVYPRFKEFGLTLGPSFQVLQQIYKNEAEILGVLRLPECREGELLSLLLHPSLLDGSLQAGMGAQLGEAVEQMFVPFSIGEVELLHPLESDCFSYVTLGNEAGKGRPENARLLKSNVRIVNKEGKVLVRIHEATGVPLRELYQKSPAEQDGFVRLCYSYDWQKAPLPEEQPLSSEPASVFFFDTEDTLSLLYREGLKDAGISDNQVVLIRMGAQFEEFSDQSYVVNPQSKEDFVELFAQLLAKGHSVGAICFAWPLRQPGIRDDAELQQGMECGVHPFLLICQAIIKHKLEAKTQLLYLYSGQAGQSYAHHAAVGGLVKALKAEHPKLLAKTIEVGQEPASHQEILDAIRRELRAHTQDAAAVRVEGADRYARKLKAIDLLPSADAPGVKFKEQGVYLITGGVGGLGLLFAKFLAERFKARLVLTGRSSLTEEKEAALKELEGAGGEVFYTCADVAHRDEVNRLIDESKARFGRIDGIIHAAGVLRDSNLRNKTREEMSAVIAPKVFGAFHLDAASRHKNLDFFVMFSSLAAVAGSVGQCDYSFANHYMDSFAAEREWLRGQGERAGKTLSINWGLWADGGMTVDKDTELYFKKSLGIKPLSASTGVESLVEGLASGRTQFAVLEGVREKVEAAWGLRPKEAPTSSERKSEGDAIAPATQSQKTNERSGQVSNELIEQTIKVRLSKQLGVEPGAIQIDTPFADYGVNSVMGVNLVHEISETLKIELDPIILFEYSTVQELAQYIGSLHFESLPAKEINSRDEFSPSPASSGRPADDAAPKPSDRFMAWSAVAPSAGATHHATENVERSTGLEPIAIVGMSGRFADSETLEDFWKHLEAGDDLVRQVTRWDRRDCMSSEQSGRRECCDGSFIESIDRFDAAFFGISPLEALWMDPQQRVFLEESWKALEDAGYAGKLAHEKQCGVYVGCAGSNYERLFESDPPAQAFWGNAVSVVPARIAYYLNLHGPAIAVDTASSSSLVAIHLACQGLWSGEMEMALAGGIFLQATPGFYQVTNRAGLLSPDGKCYSFDARANGFVPGEAAGVLVLKRLSLALRDGDFVHGLIAGSGINQDGSSNGLIAPNGRAQERLERSVYDRFKINPETIQLIEANGTGTILGDSIEAQALTRGFREYTAKKQFCALGAVATNIGHAGTAAGVAGVLKVLLALKHRQIPPLLHFEQANPAIAFDAGPFYVNTRLEEWRLQNDRPRRAAISSFGIGGTNAHLVIEEAPLLPAIMIELPGYLIPLSARTGHQVRQQASDLLTLLKHSPGLSLNDVSYTLFTGRMHLNHRICCLVRDQSELLRCLGEWLETGSAAEVFCGEIQDGKRRESVSLSKFGNHCIQECRREPGVAAYLDHLATIGDLYVQGYSLDFPTLFFPQSKRVPLPTYPFEEKRYWLGPAIGQADQAEAQLEPGPARFVEDTVRESSTLALSAEPISAS